MKWLNELINDKEQMRNIITGLIFGIPLLLLVFYFGIVDHIELELLNVSLKTIGAATLIIFFGNEQIILDWRKRSKEDYEKKDEETKNLMDEDKSVEFTDDDLLKGYEFADKKTETARLNARIQFTKRKVDKIDRAINKAIHNNKPLYEIKQLKQDKQKLKDNPLIPKWYNWRFIVVPYEYGKIKALHNMQDDTVFIEDGRGIEARPIKRNQVVGRVFRFFKSLFSAAAGVGILFTEDFWTIIVILGVYIFTAISSALLTYYLNTIYMATKNKRALKKRVSLKKECREYIDKNKALEQSKPQTHIQVAKEDNVREKENESVSEAFNEDVLQYFR